MADDSAQLLIGSNREILRTLSRNIADLPGSLSLNESQMESVNVVSTFISGLIENLEEYAERAPITVGQFANRFVEAAHDFEQRETNRKLRSIRELAVPAIRIATEKAIRSGLVSHADELALRLLSNPSHVENLELRLEAVYQLSLLRRIMEEDSVAKGEVFSDIEKRVTAARSTVDQWDAKVTEYDQRVAKLLEDYNFGGFARAFSQMLASVNQSKRWTLWLMWVIAAFAFLPPITLVLVAFFGAKQSMPEVLADDHLRLLILAPALLTYEVLCVYFFRVVLRSFQSSAAQASQLGMRLAACAFIQQYAQFAGGQKPQTLEKFEALVFSGLAIEPGKVPSTFDGLEHVIAALKGTKADH